MAESLKEVIAKLKQQQNSQASKNEGVKPAKVEIPAEIGDEDEEDAEDEEETAQEQKKSPVKPSQEEIAREQQILMEIEMLQNNGRFRAELLHQMQEINRALVVIAGVLVDQNGKKG